VRPKKHPGSGRGEGDGAKVPFTVRNHTADCSGQDEFRWRVVLPLRRAASVLRGSIRRRKQEEV
jgi:hypothetical protein